MKNPWKEIALSDYENHMKLDSVMQLQALNAMMKNQLHLYLSETVMILGIAGGNGLEHVDTNLIHKVYGVDINSDYLQESVKRYKNLEGIYECICADLTDRNTVLPHADLVIANLLIEYIGYACFQNTVKQVNPLFVSCIIQINKDEGFVSDSPYIHVFDHLGEVHHQMQVNELTACMRDISYGLIAQKEETLPNGKCLVQLDFKRQHKQQSSISQLPKMTDSLIVKS